MVIEGHKPCSRCREMLPLTFFDRHGSHTSGYASQCKTCGNRRKMDRRAKGLCLNCGEPSSRSVYCLNCKEKALARNSRGTRRRALLVDERCRLLAWQNHICPICLKPLQEGINIAVDHCHTTGRIHGLVHRQPCNAQTIQTAETRPDDFARAIEYLKKPPLNL